MPLEALSFERWVDDDRLPSDRHGLGVCGTPFGLVGGTDLSRRLGQDIEAIEILTSRERQVDRLSLVLSGDVFVLVSVGQVGEFVESQQDALSIAQRNGLTLLDEMVGQAVDATLGEFFAAGLARVLVTVTGVLEFLAANEELKDELVRFATHCGERECVWQQRKHSARRDGDSRGGRAGKNRTLEGELGGRPRAVKTRGEGQPANWSLDSDAHRGATRGEKRMAK